MVQRSEFFSLFLLCFLRLISFTSCVKMEEKIMEIDSRGVSLDNTAEVLLENGSQNEEYVFQYPTLFASKTLLELSNSSYTVHAGSKRDEQTYVRGCKWSPDGTCCLSVVNNDGMHVTELPRDLYVDSPNTLRNIDILEPVIHVKESGLVYDFCWYPGMNSQVPETCSWLTTKRNAPVQMWDAFDGSLRCSYRGFNAVDEMEPAISICFTPDATRIVAGYKKVLRTFDVERPGRDCSEHKISSPASCLATDSNLLAVGSWNTAISLYNVNEAGGYKSIGKMHGHGGGVTHMKFTPDGLKLVSGARKDHRLLIWDIRYYRRPLNILSRAVDTNQRVYFDVSPCGKYLVTGGTDGIVKVWDVDHTDWKSELDAEDMADNPSYKFPLHKDCCNSVSIHPSRPILATGSGQYHFTDPVLSIDEENLPPNVHQSIDPVQSIDEESLPRDEQESKYFSVERNQSENSEVDMKYSSQTENCVVFWWIGEVNV